MSWKISSYVCIFLPTNLKLIFGISKLLWDPTISRPLNSNFVLKTSILIKPVLSISIDPFKLSPLKVANEELSLKLILKIWLLYILLKKFNSSIFKFNDFKLESLLASFGMSMLLIFRFFSVKYIWNPSAKSFSLISLSKPFPSEKKPLLLLPIKAKNLWFLIRYVGCAIFSI